MDDENLTLEQRIIADCLRLYKEFSCLWDNRQVLYTNTEARNRAYEVLVEKYKQINDNMTIAELKKKLENMRTSYRREHKKVLVSRLRGDDPEYIPQLWYYEHLKFLNEVLDFKVPVPVTTDDDSVKLEFDNDCTPKTKKRKSSDSNNSMTIYLPQQDNDSDYEYDDNGDMINDDGDNEMISHSQEKLSDAVGAASESEAFGTLLGFQLKDLDQMQRAIAEKLISDIIFHARMNRLSMNSSLNI